MLLCISEDDQDSLLTGLKYFKMDILQLLALFNNMTNHEDTMVIIFYCQNLVIVISLIIQNTNFHRNFIITLALVPAQCAELFTFHINHNH